MSNVNRNKGHNWERKVRKDLQEAYPKVETSRYASREQDDKAIDFVNTGNLAIQAKNYKTKPNFKNEFNKMQTDKIKLLAFKWNKIRGKSGEYAVMQWDDFVKMIQDIGIIY